MQSRKKAPSHGGPDNAVRTRSGGSIVSNEYSPQMLRLRLACLRAGVARDIAQKASERDALLPAAARPMKAGLAALEPAVARTGAATDTVAMAMVDISERLLRLTSEAVTSLTDCDGAQRCGAGRRRCFGVDWTCDVSESKMEMSVEKRADGREILIDAHPIESRLDRNFYFFTHRLDPHSKSTKWVKMTSISRKTWVYESSKHDSEYISCNSSENSVRSTERI